MLVVGHPSRVEDFLSSPEGHAHAAAWARDIWADPERLAEFELGRERYPHGVEAQLDALIAVRNGDG